MYEKALCLYQLAKGAERDSTQFVGVLKLMAKSKNARTGKRIKVCFALIAIVNCLTVAGLFLAGYGTQALPPVVANFMLSEMFLYILNILLALTIVLCVCGIVFTAKDFSSAGSNPAMEKKQAATKKHRKDDVKMKVADNTQATEETQNVAPTPEDVPASDMKFAEDELDDESEPLDEEVTETVPPVEPQPVEDVHEDIDDTGEISEKEMIETVLQVAAAKQAEPENVVPPKPQLQKIEEVIQQALISAGIPTSLWGIEEDKEGAECMMFNPEEDSWYLYTIKNGQTENFEFFMNSEAHKAGKRFLERVRNRMAEAI